MNYQQNVGDNQVITARVVSKPYPMVKFSNGKQISYNVHYESFEHNIKNAMYSAKLFNGLDELAKRKTMDVLFCNEDLK